jgi:hypothetical protein
MTNADRPLHRRLEDLALLFAGLAKVADVTMRHIAVELTYADGYPQRTPGASPSTARNARPAYDESGNLLAPVKLTPVEAAAERALQLRADRDQMLDDVEACESFAHSMSRVMRTAQGTRIARTDVNNGRCYTDPVRPGYYLTREEGGWSDPACTNKSRTQRAGMCDACRQREASWRGRQERKAKPLDDDRTVDHDSTVRLIDGVAIVREVRGAA